MSILQGVVRRFARTLGYEANLRMTNLESLAVAQVEPEGAELARAGLRFYGGAQGAATGRAPVAVIPTTAALWMLWNGESQGGKSYFLEQLTIAQLSGTAAVGFVVLVGLTTAAIAAPAAAANFSTGSASKGTPASKAVWGENLTLAATPVWLAAKGNGNPATVTNGGDTWEAKGRICVPPGYGLPIHVLSGPGATPLFLPSAVWSEMALDIE